MGALVLAWIIVSPFTNSNGGYPQDRFMYADRESCEIALADRSGIGKHRCVPVRIIRPGS